METGPGGNRLAVDPSDGDVNWVFGLELRLQVLAAQAVAACIGEQLEGEREEHMVKVINKPSAPRRPSDNPPPGWGARGGGRRPDRLGLRLVASEILRVWVLPAPRVLRAEYGICRE